MSSSPLATASDDRLADMLFQGEEIETEFTLEDARIAITSHRVLAFTPGGDGRRFDHADRPNVVDAYVRTTGTTSYLTWSVRAAVYGAIFLGGGYLLTSNNVLGAVARTEAPETSAVGGITNVIGTVTAVLAFLTNALLAVGAAVLLAAVAFAGLYIRTRDRELLIERAGRDPIRVPLDDGDGEAVARRVRTVVGTGSKPPAE